MVVDTAYRREHYILLGKEKDENGGYYTDKMVSTIWKGIGFTFFATIMMMFIFGGWMLMIPLSLLYVSIGVCMMGNILCDKWMSRLPAFGLMMSIIILCRLFKGEFDWNYYLLTYILSSIIVLIIPGHVMNRQAKKEGVCSEN